MASKVQFWFKSLTKCLLFVHYWANLKVSAERFLPQFLSGVGLWKRFELLSLWAREISPSVLCEYFCFYNKLSAYTILLLIIYLYLKDMNYRSIIYNRTWNRSDRYRTFQTLPVKYWVDLPAEIWSKETPDIFLGGDELNSRYEDDHKQTEWKRILLVPQNDSQRETEKSLVPKGSNE